MFHCTKWLFPEVLFISQLYICKYTGSLHDGVCFTDTSLVMRKSAFCICKNKDVEQLPGNREADQRLCFHYMASKFPLLPNSEISSF